MVRRITWLALFALLTWSVGCATPQARIRRNPEVFASFPEEVKAAIRKGEVEVGFSAEMTLMALGAPDRKYRRESMDGESEVWSYVGSVQRGGYYPSTGWVWHRDKTGRLYQSPDWGWVDVGLTVEYEALRVEFRDGKVVAFECIRK